ncbi:Uncharacterised protein [Mycobacteroides abscessus subsp. abscessus]|nr:Uncharacterised protein [Mycobacteroides abscessus subsp. abscessus]
MAQPHEVADLLGSLRVEQHPVDGHMSTNHVVDRIDDVVSVVRHQGKQVEPLRKFAPVVVHGLGDLIGITHRLFDGVAVLFEKRTGLQQNVVQLLAGGA